MMAIATATRDMDPKELLGNLILSIGGGKRTTSTHCPQRHALKQESDQVPPSQAARQSGPDRQFRPEVNPLADRRGSIIAPPSTRSKTSSSGRQIKRRVKRS